MKLLYSICLLATTIIWSCSTPSGKDSKEEIAAEEKDPGLKDYYEDYFVMGVAVSPEALTTDEAELIKQHFGSMTAENVMKMGLIHPEEERYNWEPADKIVDFARKHDMQLRGHALCWHNQVPDWIYTDAQGDTVSKDILLQRLQTHITEVVTRYKDDIYAWDVVNEAIADGPDRFYRDTPWYRICGEEFIAKAFEYARAADPDVELFYNDYEVINPVKRKKIYKLVKELKEAGVPIDGVGIQGHWSIYEPSEEQLRETIEMFTDLGLKVQITELDVSVHHKEHSRRDKNAADDDKFTPERQQGQIAQYDMIFKVFRSYKKPLSAVTFWNISDRHSWLDDFPVRGRKDYPLLFDENLKPKEVYHKVVNFKKDTHD